MVSASACKWAGRELSRSARRSTEVRTPAPRKGRSVSPHFLKGRPKLRVMPARVGGFPGTLLVRRLAGAAARGKIGSAISLGTNLVGSYAQAANRHRQNHGPALGRKRIMSTARGSVRGGLACNAGGLMDASDWGSPRGTAHRNQVGEIPSEQLDSAWSRSLRCCK